MVPYSLKISDDKLKAFLMLESSENANFTFDELISYINGSGVVYGINEDAIKSIIDRKATGEKLLIAEAKLPVRGADGSIEYRFETQRKLAPKIRADGSVDFHNLNLTQNVVSGQELARLVPPTDGEDGINVLGNIIHAPKGKPTRLHKGKNTNFADDEKNVLKSDIDGNVKLDHSGAVEVDAAFTVKNNVDFNTGNIDINGDLIIQGDVKAGFKVRASGDIEIGGTIEDSEITSDGSILAKGGFLGDGKGMIKAHKNVILKFVRGQKVLAGENIEVHEEAIQADLMAEGSVNAQDGRGIVIGGVVRAGKNASIRIIGNIQYTKTEIIVAEKSGLKERIDKLNKDVSGLDAKLNEITGKMTFIMSKGSKAKLSIAEENEFRLLDKLSADITATHDTLVAELTGLEEKLRELRAVAFVYVSNRIYPGTVLKIAGLVREINEELGSGEFRVVDGQIAYLP
jgi:hypothetical protein